MSDSVTIRDLVIGTHNRKKGLELAELLAPWGFRVATLDDVPGAIEVVEDGDSFAANAVLKATEQAKHLGRWVLADDSGLEVDALGGAPGIYSARFAGPNATDDDNNRHLLEKLGDLPLERRTARYVCHVTVADPTGVVRAESHDTCRGRIRFEPRWHEWLRLRPVFRSGRVPPHVRRTRPDGEADAQPPLAGAAGDSAAARSAQVGRSILRYN